jgi:mgtE-like transporter
MVPSVAHQFASTVKQSVMAFAFNIFGVIAGTMIAYHIGLFDHAPWVIAIYPPILSARGVIAGLFCGRLSIGLHLGTVQPRFFGNTKSFYLLFQAIVVITLQTSIAMSLIALLFGSLFLKIMVTDFFSILTVVMATMALSLIIISPITMAVSFLSFKHGLDPDIILYPVESTSSDLLITIIYILIVNMFFLADSFGRYIIAFLSLTLLLVASYILLKNFKQTEFIKTVKESLFTLFFVAFIVNITGTTLGKISELIGERREVYTVYPALIDTMGDVGAVVGSTATTKLALGTLKSSLSAIKNHMTEILGAWTASLIMFFMYSLLSLTINRLLTASNILRFTALLLGSNLIAASFIIIVSYAVAILTYQKGLDPDNFVIPIESSLADSITTISLLLALTLTT